VITTIVMYSIHRSNNTTVVVVEVYKIVTYVFHVYYDIRMMMFC